MTLMRYWALCLAAAICGGFIAIERFAFGSQAAAWIAFGVAVAATVFSVGAFLLALARDNHALSGLGALSALIAGWTVIATLVFNPPTALWLAFADGLVLVLVSFRALALHETTVERVVHALERSAPVEPRPAQPAPSTAGERPLATGELSAPMRSWMYWLTQMGIALAGAFVVLLTFALTAPGTNHASPRWIAFGIGIAASCLAFAGVLSRVLAGGASRLSDGEPGGPRATAAAALASLGAPVAMIVTMAVYGGDTARWIAFALGCAMVGVSLIALALHELTTERVRHELEVSEPRPAPQPAGSPAGLAA
jgi:hypothetical protein